MGVGSEYLGRKVRCPNPNCKQVVLAPEAGTAAAPAAPPPPKPAAKSPPPSPADAGLPKLNLPAKDEAESIFGNENDDGDEVFSSTPGNRLPTLPPIEPPAEAPQPPAADDPFGFMSESPPPQPKPKAAPPKPVENAAPPPEPRPPKAVKPKPAPKPAPPPAYDNPFDDLETAAPGDVPLVPPTADLNDVFAGFEAPPAPAPPPPPKTKPVAVAVPPPAAAVVVIPLPPEPAPAADPFGGIAAAVPVVKPVAEARVEEPPPVRERKPARDRAAAGGSGSRFKIACFILIPYALLMTGLAVYGLFIKTPKVDTGHPLSTIPDNFGEFPPAERKKFSQLGFPVDGALPPELKVALGEKIPVGQIEVEPVKVEARKLRVTREGKGKGNRAEVPLGEALVLTLKVRNTSDDLTIYPLDPAFNRKVQAGAKGQCATGLVVGKQTFWGGAIAWPFGERVAREYEEAQANDATPLKPGESREYVVFTDAKKDVVKAALDAPGELKWRVQVRRGLIPYLGKDVPVTAIVEVGFNPSDVKTAGV